MAAPEGLPSLFIERVSAADVRVVLPLFAAQFAEHGIAASGEALEQAVRGLVDSEGRGAVLAAYEDGRAIGVAALAFTWTLEHSGRSAWLDELYVVPDRRGRGVGTALLRRALEVAASERCLAVDLEVDSAHARAEGLYARERFAALPRRRFACKL